MTEFDDFQGWCILKGDRSLQRALKRQVHQKVEYYQLHTLDSAIKKTSKRRIAIDVGAHYGVMTYTLSKLFEHVHAFEIDPDAFACLEKNIAKFNMTNVTAHPYGLGDKDDEVGLNKTPGKSFSTHVNPDAVEDLVPIRSLDSFGLENVDLIKIDAEGFEPFVVQGGLNTITRSKPVILYERKGHETRYGRDRDSVLDMLEPLGYRELYLNDCKNKLIGV